MYVRTVAIIKPFLSHSWSDALLRAEIKQYALQIVKVPVLDHGALSAAFAKIGVQPRFLH
jgi:hypothetical protein